MMVTLLHFLTLGGLVFGLGVLGILLNRSNIIVMLMSIELMFLATNITFVAFSRFYGGVTGEIFTFFVLAVSSAEAAIGLAILVICFRQRGRIDMDEMRELSG